jgi:hypothetical protein
LKLRMKMILGLINRHHELLAGRSEHEDLPSQVDYCGDASGGCVQGEFARACDKNDLRYAYGDPLESEVRRQNFSQDILKLFEKCGGLNVRGDDLVAVTKYRERD